MAAALIPFLLLALLFQLQLSFGVLRYLNPIVRYVFIVGSAFAVVQILQAQINHSKTASILGASLAPQTVFIGIWSSISSLCILVLMISWSNGGTLDYSVTGGVLPWSDAAGYLEGAQRVLYDGYLTGFTERRPLNALFFAARLFMTGNNFFAALILQALLAAFALSLATRAVLQTHGKTIALLFFLICFSFVGIYVQKTLSEALGISLGLIAFSVQWGGIANNKLMQYSIGTFVLALALLARAGAMFVLPASVLFAFLFFSADWQKRCVAALAAISAVAAAWLFNLVMIRLYGTNSNGVLLSNFSYVIYGLSQGGLGWTRAVAEVQLGGGGGEAEVAALLYRKTMETILAHPSLLIWGIFRSLAHSVAALPVHMLRLIADGSDGSAPSTFRHVAIAAAFVLPAICFAAFKTLSTKGYRLDRFDSFLLINLAGLVASLPFFYLDGGIRLTAATFPLMAATVALLFSVFTPLAGTKPNSNVARSNATMSYAATVAIIITSLCLPAMNHTVQSGPAPGDKQCSAPEQPLVMRIGRGSAHLNIVSDAAEVSVAPNVRQGDFVISEINESRPEWQSLVAPVTVLMALDQNSKALRQIVGPLGFADGPTRLTQLCAIPLENSIFSHRVIP